MALSPQQLELLHQLHAERWSARKIARRLLVSRRTVGRYLAGRLPAITRPDRTSMLQPFQPVIADLLERDPSASAVVIRQRLQPLGYSGGLTVLRSYLRSLRRRHRPLRAYVRVESAPGDCFQVDWGHFGALDYDGDRRKLYAFCLVECHSRRLSVEFTHSQGFETFLRCHQHGFRFMTGIARQILYDNLLSAVAEHEGQLVRFNPRFLAFAREYDFYPRACHVAAPWEKGKIERGGIAYLRQNFSSGPCASSKTWPMSTVRPAPGSTKWPTSASTVKPASGPTCVFSPQRCERCRHWRVTAVTRPSPWSTPTCVSVSMATATVPPRAMSAPA